MDTILSSRLGVWIECRHPPPRVSLCLHYFKGEHPAKRIKTYHLRYNKITSEGEDDHLPCRLGAPSRVQLISKRGSAPRGQNRKCWEHPVLKEVRSGGRQSCWMSLCHGSAIPGAESRSKLRRLRSWTTPQIYGIDADCSEKYFWDGLVLMKSVRHKGPISGVRLIRHK